MSVEPRLCQQCRAQVEAGKKFCGTCGAATVEQGSATIPAAIPAQPLSNSVPPVAGSKSAVDGVILKESCGRGFKP
jgi:predicted amidophosphoribosyltransferase